MSDSPPESWASSRREGRERLLGLLYESETREVPLDELIAGLPVPLTGYARQIAAAMGSDWSELDALIEGVSHRWKLVRMPAVDRALLRLGTFELAHRPDVPAGAIISEAVELATEYSTDSSSRFVNGILARLAHDLRPEEERPDVPPADELAEDD